MSSSKIPLTVSLFIDWLTELLDDREYAEEYINHVYLKDPGGCLPDDYIGDELLDSIRLKFWYPIRWIVEHASRLGALAVPIHEIGIIIEPSYEDRTHVLVFLSDRVLYYDSWKAWHFWWPSDEEFERWANDVASQILTRLTGNPILVTPETK